jgi:ribonucleotide reductase beta subunit family protein with ferritin-like domain
MAAHIGSRLGLVSANYNWRAKLRQKPFADHWWPEVVNLDK